MMEAYPDTETGNGWNVTLEIGPYPTSDNTCTLWRSTFVENNVLRGVKDYRFCRGHGADDIYTDEGGDVTLGARWIHDVLVTSFKYKGVFAVHLMRMRGDTLEEEIVISDDDPAVKDVPLTVQPRSMHIMRMKKLSI